MGKLKLNRKQFTNYKGNTSLIPDYSGTGRWQHAAGKAGVSAKDYQGYTKHWENHAYIRNVQQVATNRFEGAQGTRYGYGNALSPVDRRLKYYNPNQQKIDPFAKYRPNEFGKGKDNFVAENGFARWTENDLTRDAITVTKNHAFNPLVGGVRKTTNKVYNPGDEGYEDAYNNANSRIKEQDRSIAQGIGGYGPGALPYLKKEKSTYGHATGERVTNTKEARVFNNAVVDNELYNTFQKGDKDYYGLTFAQAYGKDPQLAGAGQVINAAYQYRRARARKKSGLSSVASIAARAVLSYYTYGLSDFVTKESASRPGTNPQAEGEADQPTTLGGAVKRATEAKQQRKAQSDKVASKRSRSGRRTTVLNNSGTLIS